MVIINKFSQEEKDALLKQIYWIHNHTNTIKTALEGGRSRRNLDVYLDNIKMNIKMIGRIQAENIKRKAKAR